MDAQNVTTHVVADIEKLKKENEELRKQNEELTARLRPSKSIFAKADVTAKVFRQKAVTIY